MQCDLIFIQPVTNLLIRNIVSSQGPLGRSNVCLLFMLTSAKYLLIYFFACLMSSFRSRHRQSIICFAIHKKFLSNYIYYRMGFCKNLIPILNNQKYLNCMKLCFSRQTDSAFPSLRSSSSFSNSSIARIPPWVKLVTRTLLINT